MNDKMNRIKQEKDGIMQNQNELKKQIRASEQEAVYFQGQSELLKSSLRRDIQLLKDREEKQRQLRKKEREVFQKSHNLTVEKITKLQGEL